MHPATNPDKIKLSNILGRLSANDIECQGFYKDSKKNFSIETVLFLFDTHVQTEGMESIKKHKVLHWL